MAYVSIESGILHLDSEITWQDLAQFLAILREMDNQTEIEAIKLHISGIGGSMLAAVAIGQALRACRKTVRTVGTGYVASGAVYVLAAGTPGAREVTAGTLLMVHTPRLPRPDQEYLTPSAMLLHAQEMAVRAEHFLGDFDQMTGHHKPFWAEQLAGRSDWFIKAEEAVTLGIVDTVTKPSYPRP